MRLIVIAGRERHLGQVPRRPHVAERGIDPAQPRVVAWGRANEVEKHAQQMAVRVAHRMGGVIDGGEPGMPDDPARVLNRARRHGIRMLRPSQRISRSQRSRNVGASRSRSNSCIVPGSACSAGTVRSGQFVPC
jgi:hypothetical protein